jgi:hypothetical protein
MTQTAAGELFLETTETASAVEHLKKGRDPVDVPVELEVTAREIGAENEEAAADTSYIDRRLQTWRSQVHAEASPAPLPARALRLSRAS